MKTTLYCLLTTGLLSNPTYVLAVSIQARHDYQNYQYCAYPAYTQMDSIASTDAGNYFDCSAACFQMSECKSFAFDPAGDCELYNLSASHDGMSYDAKSTYHFWDIACEQTPACGWGSNGHNWPAMNFMNNTNQQDCSDACASQVTCKSYAYGNATGECYLYDIPSFGIIGPRISSGTKYHFYDRPCFVKATASTTTSTATEVQSTPTTTDDTSTPTSTDDATTSTVTDDTSTPTTTDDGSTNTTTDDASMPTSSDQVITTTITISEQAYFCTAMN